MSQLSREECIEVGLTVPAVSLLVWATQQFSLAKGRLDRLKGRGITPPFLKEAKVLLGRVTDQETTLGNKKVSFPPEMAQSQEIREEALAYLQEAKQIIKIEFGTSPEIQVKSRLGVRTGRLLANICQEMECVVAVLREHSSQLSWLGVDDAFIKAGDGLVGRLKENAGAPGYGLQGPLSGDCGPLQREGQAVRPDTETCPDRTAGIPSRTRTGGGLQLLPA